jgi:phenylpropionate dioxygenase-like ring-hydroxylating dioxygenase large terminal subunit
MLQDAVLSKGPRLADGTPFGSLIDYERREVSLRLLADPEVYRHELIHIFGKVWNPVAHESEIPNPGDYVMRYIGEDSVIVTRDKAGEIHVLLNVCSHRGMQICRAEGGKGNQFKCPYHGWTFSNTGRFLGAPIASECMHGTIMSKEELGLPKARVETYVGMIFANWDPEAPSLSDYLGDIKWYLDLMFDRTDGGLEVLGPPQRFMINANWKCAGEQHAGDGYHTLTLHQSLNELQQTESTDDRPVFQGGLNVSANGHGLRCIDMRDTHILALKGKTSKEMSPLDRLAIAPPAGLSAEQVPALAKRFSPEQLRVLADFPPSVGGLFPNVGTFSMLFPLGEVMSGFIAWHAFVPKGPNQFEFFNWFFAEKDASEEARALLRRTSTMTFGISGIIETDDADTWPQMTRSARGLMGSKQKIRYQAFQGESKPADWPGGGHVYDGFGKDDNQWNWWVRYFDYMNGEA